MEEGNLKDLSEKSSPPIKDKANESETGEVMGKESQESEIKMEAEKFAANQEASHMEVEAKDSETKQDEVKTSLETELETEADKLATVRGEPKENQGTVEDMKAEEPSAKDEPIIAQQPLESNEKAAEATTTEVKDTQNELSARENSKEDAKTAFHSNTNATAVEPATNMFIEESPQPNKVVIESNVLLIPSATITIPTSTALNSLSLLSQYDSDDGDDDASDVDSVIEVPVTSSKVYRTQVVEIKSDSESDTSSSDSDVECLTKMRRVIEKRIDCDDDDDDDDDDSEDGKASTKKYKKKPPKVKGEMLLDDLPPIHELQITVPEEECIELGRVHSIVDQLLLVSALRDSVLLDLDTVLFLDKGKKVLGEVFDVLGQVADPLYCVRFNSNEQIKEKNINVGDVVYVAPKTEYTQFVILSNLVKLQGSDASWENDIEPPPRYIEYSDDEQEREARAKRRNKNRSRDPLQDPPHDDTQNGDELERPPRSYSAELNADASAFIPRSRGRGRGRGGGGGFGRGRGRGAYSTEHSPLPQHYNGNPDDPGSWHSHYNQPFRHPSSNYNARFSPYMPVVYGPPPTPYNPYAQPPPHAAMHQVQVPPPMYGMNPYMRPPVLLPMLPPSTVQQQQEQQQQQAYEEAMSLAPPPPPPGE